MCLSQFNSRTLARDGTLIVVVLPSPAISLPNYFRLNLGVVPREFGTATAFRVEGNTSFGRFGYIEYRAKFEIDDFSYGGTNPHGFRAIYDRHRTTLNSSKIRTLELLPEHNGYLLSRVWTFPVYLVILNQGRGIEILYHE